MEGELDALFWGLLSGSALLIGSAVGYFINLPEKFVAGVMAFGSGVLISVLSFDLVAEAYHIAGTWSAVLGVVAGALLYTIANEVLAIFGARHRKRSHQKKSKDDSGLAIAVGALIDGIPESIAIGLSIVQGGAVGLAVVIGIFISNLPEGLSSSAGMKSAGKSKVYVFGLWIAITIASGIASWLGYAVFGNYSEATIGFLTAVAAGGILTMIIDTMIPEAFDKTRKAAGLIVVLGFLTAFIVSHTL